MSLEKAFRLLGCLKKNQRKLVRRAVARAVLLVLKSRGWWGLGTRSEGEGEKSGDSRAGQAGL